MILNDYKYNKYNIDLKELEECKLYYDNKLRKIIVLDNEGYFINTISVDDEFSLESYDD